MNRVTHSRPWRAAAALLLITPLILLAASAGPARADESNESAAHTLQDLAFLTGHWRGDTPAGFYEEVWTQPAAGCMSGLFRWVHQDKVRVHEFILIEHEDSGQIAMRLHHFSKGMRRWEQEPLRFVLTKLDETGALFEQRENDAVKTLRYERKGENALRITLSEPAQNGAMQNYTFNLQRP